MIKLSDKKYILFFAELGEYDEFKREFNTHKEAKTYQEKLIKEANNSDPEFGYYTYIAKIIKIRRKEPDEKEQQKTFDQKQVIKK